MDNLPNDPPPPFGSGFNPHTNPVDPSNPYQTQPQPSPVPPPAQTPPPYTPNNPDALKHEHYSEAAQNKPRDEHGHFIHTNPVPQTPIQSGQTSPISSKILSEAEGPNLPKLYSGLEWEVTQSKTLLFTSGKRRIEQEGVYLESAQVADYPQAFLDYYTNELTLADFKQTLNSAAPSGTTITFAKDELFLTFGVKNIYSGSGDNKKTLPAGRQVIGYKAFIEHN